MEIIGYVMLGMLVLGIYCCIASLAGWRDTTIIYGVSLFLTAWIVIAGCLIAGGF